MDRIVHIEDFTTREGRLLILAEPLLGCGRVCMSPTTACQRCPIPSMHMAAVWSGPIAVPDLSNLCRTCLERGEAPLHETRLTFHAPDLTPCSNSISSSRARSAALVGATHLPARRCRARSSLRCVPRGSTRAADRTLLAASWTAGSLRDRGASPIGTLERESHCQVLRAPEDGR